MTHFSAISPPSVNAENRLGIIYTLLKFPDQTLLTNLLETSNIGRDVFLSMYLHQLCLTYSLYEDTRTEVEKQEAKEEEQSVNCLLKTLQLRMAKCIIMISTKDGVSVPLKVMNKAQALIDHHNLGLQAVLPVDDELNSQDNDDDNCDMASLNSCDSRDFDNDISAEDYLTVPDHLLTDGHAITLNPQHLMLPQGKHFRIPSLKTELYSSRRSNRSLRDDKKLRADFLLSPRSVDLTQPVCWKTMDVPMTFLFASSGQVNNKLSFVYQLFNKDLFPFIQQTNIENALEEQQTMEVVRKLLAVKPGKPGVDLITTITNMQDTTLNRPLHTLLQQMAKILPKLPSKQDCKLLLELTAFQLFAELNPSDRQFKRLIKMLYIIQSRSVYLRTSAYKKGKYGNNYHNKFMVECGKLIKSAWSQPDGLLGSRIRLSVKAAFKHSDKNSSYEQVMNSILESMRPSNQPSDNYPKLIQNTILNVEEVMNLEKKWLNLNDQHRILNANMNFSNHFDKARVKRLIHSASKLCELFFQEECATNDSQISSNIVNESSDWTNALQNNRTQDNTLSPAHYLHDQLRPLISEIGTWVNQISRDGLISEEDAAEVGIDRLEQFANSSISVNQNLSLQNEDEILVQIINLCDSFHQLQDDHKQWQSVQSVLSTRVQWIETKNTLKQLQSVTPLPDPNQLQEQINKILIQPENHEFSPEDRQLLGTVFALRVSHTGTEVLIKALNHQDINLFRNFPEALSCRITEMNNCWSDSVKALHHTYHSLKRTLTELHNDTMYWSYEAVLAMRIDLHQRWHEDQMARLKSTQRKCELHPLQQFSYCYTPPLLSIFESMERSHTAKHSGIEAKPLSKQQELQLQAVIRSVPTGISLSGSDSLFSLIGMGKTRHQRQKTVCALVLTFTKQQWYGKNRDLLKHHVSSREGIVNGLERNLQEMNKACTDNVEELKKLNETLSDRLGNRQFFKIVIDGQTYSYADALVAFINKDNLYVRDVNRAQLTASLRLYQAQDNKKKNQQNYLQEKQWLEFARECQSRGIEPGMLPEVMKLMDLESMELIDDIESLTVDLQQQIQTAKNIIEKNSEKVTAAVTELEARLKPTLEAEKQKTRDAELLLCEKAFEHGQYLSKDRAIQRVLCQCLHEKRDAASIRATIVKDCEDQTRHVPTNHTDIIEPLYTGSSDWQSPYNLVFHIINVPGAFPLLESLYKQGKIQSLHLLRDDKTGTQSSALIFAAAKGRYRACETLIKCLEETKGVSLETLNLLLTSSPSGDNRNLLHHLAELAMPGTIKALLQLLTTASKNQDFDTDYALDSLANCVALDREYLIKKLLNQADYEGHHPTELLLFNVAKKIREFPNDNENELAGYCNEFLINEIKSMWIIVAESRTVEQLCSSVGCFMKGINDLNLLTPAKRHAAETFLKQLMRIFRVHGPDKQYEQLEAQLTSSVEETDIPMTIEDD